MQEYNDDVARCSERSLNAPAMVAIICDFIQTAIDYGLIFIRTGDLIHSGNSFSMYASLILNIQDLIIFGFVLFINFK
jgi:hypothetical protein